MFYLCMQNNELPIQQPTKNSDLRILVTHISIGTLNLEIKECLTYSLRLTEDMRSI